ncbi:MAG: ABC transporter ATP-binding protein [Actinomycetota bacterium]
MFGGGGGGWMLLRHGGSELEKGYKLAPGTVTRARKLCARYRWSIAFYLLVVTGSSFLTVLPAKIVQWLIDNALFPSRKGFVTPIANGHYRHLVIMYALAGIGVAVLVAVTGLAARYLSSRVGEGLIYDLRVRLFDHVQRMPIAFFTRTQTGALISRLNNDVVGAQSAVTNTLGTVLQSAITLGVTLTTMMLISWQITLLALLVLPVFLVPSKRVGKRLQRLTRQQMNLNANMNATMQERFNVSGAMLAKLFGHPREERDGFSSKAAEVRDMGVRIAVYARTFFILLGVVAAIGSAIVYLLGGLNAVSGSISLGGVVALVTLVSQLYIPLMALTNARVDLMTSFVSFERVFEVLDLPHMVADAPDASDLTLTGAASIEFADVTFRYPRAQDVSVASLETIGNFFEEQQGGDVLKGVSFLAEPGATVALVGPSGAGKTTITTLIPRLYDVTGGAVIVGGRDVRGVTQESLRRHIGVVAQDPHLFHDTIRNNLTYARPDSTEEELIEACRAAQIYELIASLPEGLNTVVGERGYRLSGGEKQRLAIARVLLKAPPIVILDEATSHLDSESEVLIQRALDAALSNRTSVVIAHRLSTILNADQILVVDDGRIVQRGRHSELVAMPGLYADLYTTQFARAVELT